jgi:GNAT superfamily N-acetyltransferase
MIRYEQLTVDDGPRLRSIRLRALLDAPDAFGSTLEEAVGRPAESWSKQLLELPTFVAVSEDVDVGIVRCAHDKERMGVAWLISMWVAPEVRRRGIGGTLLDLVIEWAHSNGVNLLLLDVADQNLPAVALYDSKGFKPSGEKSTLPFPREHIREHQRELKLA